jgi:hypothetical protein
LIISAHIVQAQTCPVDDMLSTFLRRASTGPKRKQLDLLKICLREVVCAYSICQCIAWKRISTIHSLQLPTSHLLALRTYTLPEWMTLKAGWTSSVSKITRIWSRQGNLTSSSTLSHTMPSRTQRLSYAAQQPKVSLLWKDAPTCIEFKRPTKTGLRQPKAKYTVEEYVLPSQI